MEEEKVAELSWVKAATDGSTGAGGREGHLTSLRTRGGREEGEEDKSAIGGEVGGGDSLLARSVTPFFRSLGSRCSKKS